MVCTGKELEVSTGVCRFDKAAAKATFSLPENRVGEDVCFSKSDLWFFLKRAPSHYEH